MEDLKTDLPRRGRGDVRSLTALATEEGWGYLKGSAQYWLSWHGPRLVRNPRAPSGKERGPHVENPSTPTPRETAPKVVSKGAGEAKDA